MSIKTNAIIINGGCIKLKVKVHWEWIHNNDHTTYKEEGNRTAAVALGTPIVWDPVLRPLMRGCGLLVGFGTEIVWACTV